MTNVPRNVTLEKLKGFVSEFKANIVQVTCDSVVLDVDVGSLLVAKKDRLLKILVDNQKLTLSESAKADIYVLRSVKGADPTPMEEYDAVALPGDVPLSAFLANPANGVTLSPAGRAFLLVGPENIHQRAFAWMCSDVVHFYFKSQPSSLTTQTHKHATIQLMLF
jgi:hypothetical protein